MGIIVITGPTGVGKSDFALEIARHMPVEIINADVGQLYEPLRIGTARPSDDYNNGLHHLFGIMHKPEHFTVVAFRQNVQDLIAQIHTRGRVPLIVGGSGFYVKALFFPPDERTACAVDPELSVAKEAASWEQLRSIDPVRAAAIHPHDTYRIARALTIWRQTGQLPSLFHPAYKPIDTFLLLNVDRDRDELNERINVRTRHMLASGWLEETQRLCGTAWEPFVREKNLIGYSEIATYLAAEQHETAFQELVATIQQETRRYAKRQRTFWRSFERHVRAAGASANQVQVCNLTHTPANVYVKQLLDPIRSVCAQAQP